MAYITAEEYGVITGRPQAEATVARIKRASLLLDARIGNYIPDPDTGRKLDLGSLPQHQQDAVREWVAQMVAFLYDNNDSAPSSSSISLGRFSVTEHGQRGQAMPERMNLADTILVSSRLVRRHVGTGGFKSPCRDSEVGW